jgi:hypothetical protein
MAEKVWNKRESEWRVEKYVPRKALKTSENGLNWKGKKKLNICVEKHEGKDLWS